MATRPIQEVLRAQALIGESPTWDADSGRLLWVDVLRGELHSSDVGSGSDRVFSVGTALGAVALRRTGGVVVAAGDGFAFVGDSALEAASGELRGADLTWVWRLGNSEVGSLGPTGLSVRMNDAKCDRLGRLWGGSMTVERIPGACSLYRLDADHTVTCMVENVTLSNGIAWSPDYDKMFYVDTPTRRIDVFEFDEHEGRLRDRRPFTHIAEGCGNPDGITVDEDGCVWVALARGGAVHRYKPDGEIALAVDVPAGLVTSVTFGGPQLDLLFVTTGCVGMSELELFEKPLSGSVLVYEVGTRGMAPERFGS